MIDNSKEKYSQTKLRQALALGTYATGSHDTWSARVSDLTQAGSVAW